MRWREAFVASLVCLFLGGRAGAQPSTAGAPAKPARQGPAPGYVQLDLLSDDARLDFWLSRTRGARPFARCRGACRLWVMPGKYVLHVPETETALEGSRRFAVRGPARGKIEPRTQARRRAGLSMGVTGTALAAGGLALVTAGLIMDEDSQGDAPSGGALALLGVLVFIPGAILTPIGWVKYGAHSPRLELQEQASDEPSAGSAAPALSPGTLRF